MENLRCQDIGMHLELSTRKRWRSRLADHWVMPIQGRNFIGNQICLTFGQKLAFISSYVLNSSMASILDVRFNSSTNYNHTFRQLYWKDKNKLQKMPCMVQLKNWLSILWCGLQMFYKNSLNICWLFGPKLALISLY